MKLELEVIHFLPFKLEPLADGAYLSISGRSRKFQLNSIQLSYLQVLLSVGNIKGLVEFYLGQGWLVSFAQLWNLLDFLVKEKIIQNSSFKDLIVGSEFAFSPDDSRNEEFVTNNSYMLNLPFFRTLDPQLASFLLQKVSRLRLATNNRIIAVGAKDRDLYVLLKGRVGVYRVYGHGQRQRVMVLENGSLFGEKAFFLNQERSGDVIALEDSELLRIHHLPEFDTFIKSDRAGILHHRFFVLQALQASMLFRELPGDSIDQLIFAGKLFQAPAHTVIFRESQPGNSAFVLVQGSLVVSQNGISINVLSAGSCFGEISLMKSGGIRTATVSVQQDAILMEIKQNDFYKVLSENLVLAKEVELQAEKSLQRDQSRRGRS